MRKRRFTEDQIQEILKESEAGISTPELCRKYGMPCIRFMCRQHIVDQQNAFWLIMD